MTPGMKKYRRVAVWMHRAMRLSDNAALWHAAREADEVIPVLFLGASPSFRLDSPRRLFIRGSIRALNEDLSRIGSVLTAVPGDPLREFPAWVNTHHVDAVYAARIHDPGSAARDKALGAKLASCNCPIHFFNDSLLFDKGELLTQGGEPYRVYTPFCKHTLTKLAGSTPPYPRVASLRTPTLPGLRSIDRFPDFARYDPTAGEKNALHRLRRFIRKSLDSYAGARDTPGIDGTSRLSSYLSIGSLGIRTVLQSVLAALRESDGSRPFRHDFFVRELLWREFFGHVLAHYPEVVDRPFREEFANLDWSENRKHWSRWCEGRTGYPIVDAGMRQLQQEGWIHNRVRMVVASFLTKNLRLPWQRGARWFWDTLVDADLANNTLGWQWTAGCGADAAPYFRIFNPVAQGERFDPEGTYIRRWVPELRSLPAPWIHRPWEAPAGILARAGIVPGRDYPLPLIDHPAARERALAAYARMRRATSP